MAKTKATMRAKPAKRKPKGTKKKANQASGTKYCSGCERKRKKSLFGNNASKPDGLQGWCKACFTDYNALPDVG